MTRQQDPFERDRSRQVGQRCGEFRAGCHGRGAGEEQRLESREVSRADAGNIVVGYGANALNDADDVSRTERCRQIIAVRKDLQCGSEQRQVAKRRIVLIQVYFCIIEALPFNRPSGAKRER